MANSSRTRRQHEAWEAAGLGLGEATSAQARWSLGDDRRLVAITDGERADADPHSDRPLSPEVWLDGLRTSAPHLFEASAGGGASGGRSR